MRRADEAIPTPLEMMRPTLRLLKLGLNDTDSVRARLVEEFGLSQTTQQRPERNKFINNHAWALVRLQQQGMIVRLGDKRYALTDRGKKHLRDPTPSQPIPPPALGAMPRWARQLIATANRKNGADGPRFTEEDLLILWRRCGGRCELTELAFSAEKVGSGKAKRAFAPSLDRVDPGKPYSAENCRLVMVAVNFALNAWGEDVYFMLAEAAVKSEKTRKARKTDPR